MLIRNWREGWKFLSTQLSSLGFSLLLLIEVFPDAFFHIWVALPPEIRDEIPTIYVRYAGLALIASGIIGRFIKQRNVSTQED